MGRTVQVVGMVREAWELGDESVGKLPVSGPTLTGQSTDDDKGFEVLEG